MLASAKITLLVGGSIAAYKSAELARRLIQSGAEVQVAMSQAACKFITPITFETLTGSPVYTDMFDVRGGSNMAHIDLANDVDAIVVAPATADLIARTRAGMADDLLTAILLATKAPRLFVPAMNANMWESAITQDNVSALKTYGVHFVEPEFGELSCGWVGKGRLADHEVILQEVMSLISDKTLMGSHVIVAAGPTREWIDPIRFVTNNSSGKMGYSIAKVARYRGAHVSLVSGPTGLVPPTGVDFYEVSTAEQMRQRVMKLAESGPPLARDKSSKPTKFIFMVAAVCDHRPADVSATKVKFDKSKEYSLKMIPNPDILRELGERREELQRSSDCKLRLIGFTAETGDVEELLMWAKEKMEKKSADLMVANVAQDAFGKDTNRVWMLHRTGREEEISTADKEDVADRIIKAALRC
ncbi:MAG: bifunctional phosphopantothenoylcysteine decarboxylase/phosphopantothenate--cysteine ligase CoaBC [Deltaproteobacteria bacterium]|nr:bifunctional phosphopantothenoylcysteine decarboxylase/phosphopantothenate--cysteine ligase CoaBC [Deltaproteobacteria bacterium]